MKNHVRARALLENMQTMSTKQFVDDGLALIADLLVEVDGAKEQEQMQADRCASLAKSSEAEANTLSARLEEAQLQQKNGKWVVHILGPDDVIPCDGELDALRKANEHNKGMARMFAQMPKDGFSPNDPYCVAVAESV